MDVPKLAIQVISLSFVSFAMADFIKGLLDLSTGQRLQEVSEEPEDSSSPKMLAASQSKVLESPLPNLATPAPELVTVEPEPERNLASFTVQKLKKMASAAKIKGYSRMRKRQLIDQLSQIDPEELSD